MVKRLMMSFSDQGLQVPGAERGVSFTGGGGGGQQHSDKFIVFNPLTILRMFLRLDLLKTACHICVNSHFSSSSA